MEVVSLDNLLRLKCELTMQPNSEGPTPNQTQSYQSPDQPEPTLTRVIVPQPDELTQDRPVPEQDAMNLPTDALLTQPPQATVLPVISDPVATVPDSIPGYEILSLLGRGGMGVVYKARHLALNRIVALKFIAGHASNHLLVRFRREGEAVAKLQNTNIVQIFEIGQTAKGLFIALEYVEGGSLACPSHRATRPG